MPLRVQLDTKRLAQLRAVPETVLRDLGGVTYAQAKTIVDASTPLVPVGKVDPEGRKLKDSVFLDGPLVKAGKSVSSTGGYDHPHAGAIHEGFHFGLKTMTAPAFLRQPARKGKSQFRRKVANQIMNTLKRVFS